MREQFNDMLTEEEIHELTGAERPFKQAEVLCKHGIFYVERIDGKIRTCWHHVHNPSGSKTAAPSTPNFDAIED